MTQIEDNIRVLQDGLKPGEHYVVRYDKIEKRSGLWERIKYFFRGKKEDALVRAKVSEVVKAVIKEAPNFQHDDIQGVEKFFFERLAKLPERLFDRKVIKEVDKEIRKQFFNLIHPELGKTEDKFADPVLERNRKLERRIEKVRLGIKLGVELKMISAGKSGAYFARDYKMKTVGVFKPGREESLGLNSPKLAARINYYFTKYILRIDTAAPFWANEGYVAEAMTSKLAERMQFGTVPASKITELESTKFASSKRGVAEKEEGSFQRFVAGAKSIDEEFKWKSESFLGKLMLKTRIFRHKDQISQSLKKEEFEQMAVLDFLICNRDRHFENILVKKPEGEEKLDMHLIDHQLGFPKVNPPKKDFLYARNQYKWALLPQAEQQFSPEMKDKAFKQLEGGNLKAMIQQLRQITKEKKLGETDNKEFDTEFEGTSQEIAFKQRVSVLLLVLNFGYTMQRLASYKSQEDIDAFLLANNVTPDRLDKFLGLV